MTGVEVRFFEPEDAPDPAYHPDVHECSECNRVFAASHHRRKGEDRWCVECRPVTSIKESIEKVMEKASSRPRHVGVEELLEEGDAR